MHIPEMLLTPPLPRGGGRLLEKDYTTSQEGRLHTVAEVKPGEQNSVRRARSDEVLW